MTCLFCFQSLTSAILSFLSATDDFPSHENQPDDPTKVGCSAFSLWKTHSVETSLSESTQKPHPSRDFSLLYVRVPNQLFCFRIRQDKHRFHPFSRKKQNPQEEIPFLPPLSDETDRSRFLLRPVVAYFYLFKRRWLFFSHPLMLSYQTFFTPPLRDDSDSQIFLGMFF